MPLILCFSLSVNSGSLQEKTENTLCTHSIGNAGIPGTSTTNRRETGNWEWEIRNVTERHQ